MILKYMGVDSADRVTPTSLEERIELVGKLYKQSLKRSELRDELFAQVSKQTRNNPDRYVFNQLLHINCWAKTCPLCILQLSPIFIGSSYSFLLAFEMQAIFN